MSASHFGTTYWLDDYFGPYFQPEGEGGVIIGSLAGSAAGVATVNGTLEDGAEQELGGTLRGRRRWPRRSRLPHEIERLREQTIEAIAQESIALSEGPPRTTLAKAIRAGANDFGLAQPFDLEGAARLAALVQMAQALNTMQALIGAQIDEEEEELLLLAA